MDNKVVDPASIEVENRRCGPSFDHPSWQHSHTREACWRPLSIDWCVMFVRSSGCSLFQWRKVGLPLEVRQESWPNFNEITKGK